MKAEFDKNRGGNDSVRSRGSRVSKMSSVGSQMMKEHQRYKSGIVNDLALVPSARMKPQGLNEPIMEHPGEYDLEGPETGITGLDQFNKYCEGMSEDERIINYRLMKQAVENGYDISMFPLGVKDIFKGLFEGSNKERQAKYDEMLKAGA